jgi:hypothetical protein
MCIIHALKKGTEKNTDEVFKFITQGSISNSRGSGFMFKRNGESKVNINKGYFKVEDLIEAIKAENLGVDDELVVHHRIPTGGNVDAANTHPFVISKKHDEVIMLKGVTDKPCLAHNGVFRGISLYEKLDKDYSDTYTFSRYILSNKNVMNLFLTDRDLFETILDDIIGSDKLALLFPDRDMELVGKWVEDNGYFHSNSGYKSYVHDRGGSSTNTYGYGRDADYWDGYAFSEGGLDDYSTKKNNNLPANNSFMDRTFTLKAIDKAEFLLLDYHYVLLDADNYKHFDFMKKAMCDAMAPSKKPKGFRYNMPDFDINAENQVLFRNTQLLNTEGVAIPTLNLILDFYYVPKKAYYRIYKDFLDLVGCGYPYSKSAIKKLTKQLSAAYKRKDDTLMIFKTNGKLYCKKALNLYLDYMNAMKDAQKSEITDTYNKAIIALVTPESQFSFSD